MGVGTPWNILECIAMGIDMFDCVMPTRNGRNAMLFTSKGIINIDNKKWEKDFSVLDDGIDCEVSNYYSKAYLRHLIHSGEMLGAACNVAMQASLKATLECAKSFATTDFRSDLPAFKVPTLIIHGISDKTVPINAAGRAAAKGIAQSNLVEYDGAPHGLFATDKQRLTIDLLKFIRQ